MRFWAWLDRNSSQLKALAALTIVLGGLAGAPLLLYKWLQPDIIITVANQSSTMPPALKKWTEEASSIIRDLREPDEGQKDPYRSFRHLQNTGPLKREREKERWATMQTAKMRIDLVNQTNRVIPGVRLRLDGAYPVWGVFLEAAFLTDKEIVTWHQSASFEDRGPTIVLPELPPIPPNSAMNIIAYGYLDNAKVFATVSGASYKIIATITIEDKWPASWIIRPYLFWFPLVMVIGLIIIIVIAFLEKSKQLTLRAAKKFIPYNLACKEALSGRKESAIVLLEEAIAAGYDDFQHMRVDPDLESLREMEEFKVLSRQ
jgi:hypothetical protein